MAPGLPRLLARFVCLLACLAAAPARAQDVLPHYGTLAAEPDPRDFVSRADTQLNLLGNLLRFGGVDVTWLGVRQDGHAAPRRPTPYEVRDALATANALGATVVRVPGLASTAGCPLCLETSPGQFNPEVFAQIDLVLNVAHDLGLKVVIPLADSGADCAGAGATGVICALGRTQGAAGRAAFFTDAGLRAAFARRVLAIIGHANATTGTSYRNDPTILAWEDCDACAAGGDDRAVSAWSEQLAQAIKGEDTRHLYEAGGFAGRIGAAARAPVDAALYATPHADIVGDRLTVTGDPAATRTLVEGTVALVGKSGHAYVLDGFGWSPSVWKTEADLEGWLDDLSRARDLSGAIACCLQSHADQGGVLPPQPPNAPGEAALYFPGLTTADADLETMRLRGRALRRFNFAMAEQTLAPSYLLPPQPEILGVAHGRVAWRGAAGAADYTIERAADPGAPGGWEVVCPADCDKAGTDVWQDPNPVSGQVWYRVMPLNINGHHAYPSEPMQQK